MTLFFKQNTHQSTNTLVLHPGWVEIEGRGDYAIAILIIDRFLSTQNHSLDNLSKVLLSHPTWTLERKKSEALLTPFQYMQGLCFNTNLHQLISAIATVLNHLAIESIFNHAWYFQDLLTQTPHVLLEIQDNPSVLNPWISQALQFALPFDWCISETMNKKSIPRYHAQEKNVDPLSMILLHKDNTTYTLGTVVRFSLYFNNLTSIKIPPCVFSDELIEHISHQIKASHRLIHQKKSDILDVFSTTQDRLKKYIDKESISEKDLIDMYSDYLSKQTMKHLKNNPSPCHFKCGFPPVPKTTRLIDELQFALAQAITFGEIHDFTQKMQHRAEKI